VPIAIALLACSNPIESSREVTLSISDIEVPVTIPRTGPLDIVVIVRTGGCISFRRLDVNRSGSSSVEVRGIGLDGSGPGIACPADVREERHPLTFTGAFADSVVVTGRQPDGNTLRRKVIVR
jgi:hypothetical protein